MVTTADLLTLVDQTEALLVRLRLGLKSLRQVAGTADPSIPALTAPTLTRTSSAGTNRMSWSSSYPDANEWDGVNTGDKVEMQWRVNGGSWNADTTQVLDSAYLLAGSAAWPLFGATAFSINDFVEVEERTKRYLAGVLVATSSYSNIVSDTMATSTVVLPSSITGIKDYYQVRTAKLWKDTAGTSAVTADGDLVARWDSELGTMASFLQATSGLRPIYRANSGNPYLDFDGVDDRMVAGSTALATMPQPYYCAIAVKLDALGYHQVTDGGPGSNRMIFQSVNSPPDRWQIQAGTNVASQGLTPTLNDAVIAGLFNGASSQPRLDGTGGTVVSIGAQSPIDGITLGSNNTVNGGFLDGRIYGFVLVAASPSSGDKANLDTWLGARQGRTI